MNTEELTSIATAHQNALSRHDLEMAEIRVALATVIQAQQRTEEQQQINARQIALNQQDIANLTASIMELRNVVSDYT
jgi:hypothetical protein